MKLQITTHLLLWITLSGAETTLWPPENPEFISVNTENILHWSPAWNGSKDVRYDVQYCRYGYNEDCIPVPHCTGTSHHYCDLTEETWDFNITFIAAVRSVVGNTTSKWKITDRFKPIDSTSLGLPSFDTEVGHKKIRVRIFPPTLHTAERNRSMEELYTLKYSISIRGSDTNRSAEIQSSSQPYTTDVRAGDIYCIKVSVKVNGDERKSNFTEETCVEVPASDLERLINVVFGTVGAVMALIVVCFCLVMICQKYLKKQRTTPAVLKSFEKTKRFLNIMDYLSLTENVVVQKVFADDAHHNVTRTLEQDDPWLDQKIKEASSVDSGIDIGSHLSDRMMLLGEPLNRYMQQTPDSSSLQSTNPECGQNSCQLVSLSSVHIPDATSEPGDSTGSISISGYQRQMPRTIAASEQEASSVPEQTVENSPPCFISISDISITEDLTKGFLSLGDVMLMENGF